MQNQTTGRWVECDCGKRAQQRIASLMYVCECGLRYGNVNGEIRDFGRRA